MKERKIFWGIFFILAAILVVISKLGMMPDIGVFTILITAVLICVFAEGIRRRNFYEILFSIAGVCIVYDKPLGIEALTPWTVLAAALFASIGLSILFHGGKKKYYKNNYEGDKEQCCGEHVRCENNFNTAIRYIKSDDFCNAYLENNFGSLAVYFDDAIISSAAAYVEVDNNFGETSLYIPKEWKVEIEVERAFGGLTEYGNAIRSSNTVLYVRGETSFGHIAVHYI